MAELDIRQIALPVFGTDALGATPSEICGTAFGLAEGFFVTAGHVARQAATHPIMSLGFVPPATGTGACAGMTAEISRFEIHEGIDIAILRSDGGPYWTPVWSPSSVSLLTDVVVGGYPHALDREHKEILVRAYRGHIVAARSLHNLSAKPLAYELSFSCPVGLSGAPVLTPTVPPRVVGLVVQNGRSGMVVAVDSEISTEGHERTIYERHEFLTFGLAVATPPILAIRSELLGMTIGEYLKQRGTHGA